MDEIDRIRAAAAPILAWWDAHEAASPMQNTQCVMYYKGIRVTAGEMRTLKEALSPQAAPAPVAQPQ